MNKILLGLIIGMFTMSAIACDGSGKAKTNEEQTKGKPAERSQTL